MKKGWKKTTLGAAFVTVTGNTPPKNNPNLFGQFMPLVKPPELCDSMLDSAEDGLSEAGSRVARIAPPSSVLISCIGNLGKIGLTTVPVAFNQQINAILPDEDQVVPKFMFYQVLSDRFKARLEALSSGTTVSIVNKSRFNNIEIVVPPLPEQRRIVGILDEAYVDITTAKDNAERNLKNSRALFKSYLDSVFSHRGEGWVEKRLDETCDIIMGQSPDGESYNTSGEGIPLVNGPVEFSPDSFGRTVRSKFTTQPTKLCEKGDLILCVRGSTTGRMNIAGFDACIGRGVAVIRAKEYQPWINHFINAKRDDIYRLGTGATFPNVSGPMLGGLKLSVPGLAAQIDIAAKLDALYAQTQRLASIYQRKLAALDELKQSLLHQAFSGQL